MYDRESDLYGVLDGETLYFFATGKEEHAPTKLDSPPGNARPELSDEQ
ncbi:hypothetical protein [Haladaptatus sp. DYSN1]|nr:hypothetical protein [Haladaptatus sp. DYSN1]